MRIILALLALLLVSSIAQAQEVVVQPGDTLVVIAAEPPIPEFECPVDWTCEPPPSIYVVTVSATRNDASGSLTAPEGELFVNLERRDGSWTGNPDGPIAGVDSVVFVLDGVRNSERNYPYEVSGGSIPLAVGLHELVWSVFGLESDSGTATLTVTVTVSFRFPEPVPMQDGLMRQAIFPLDAVRPIEDYIAMLDGQLGTPLPDDLGWYWLPAPTAGSITVTRSVE